MQNNENKVIKPHGDTRFNMENHLNAREKPRVPANKQFHYDRSPITNDNDSGYKK
jgi:hypothetical protein